MALLSNEAIQLLGQQLKRHEGIEYKPYHCTAGKLTIGIGRNIDDLGISEDEAFYLLNNDIKRVEQEVSNNISFLDELSDNRKIALLNMAFNLGISRLMKFKNMLSALQQHDYQTAAKEMLNSRWARQVGRRAEELAKQMEAG
ncbi:lysozyme [Sinobacterium caligoides]|uniref:Lysozyme n=1 Tax=Sinobacterium caligoides TaxID=933926 RepID=A0A3N2DQF3_9GAMM|nr:glycoside hydrolase family protein [Sinobacterium caligoides]ROS02023.1 lysozyme [Sinobacterium caligoides]